MLKSQALNYVCLVTQTLHTTLAMNDYIMLKVSQALKPLKSPFEALMTVHYLCSIITDKLVSCYFPFVAIIHYLLNLAVNEHLASARSYFRTTVLRKASVMKISTFYKCFIQSQHRSIRTVLNKDFQAFGVADRSHPKSSKVFSFDIQNFRRLKIIYMYYMEQRFLPTLR